MYMHNCIQYVVVLALSSGPGRFTITSVTIGADHYLINVTFVQVSHVITLLTVDTSY